MERLEVERETETETHTRRERAREKGERRERERGEKERERGRTLTLPVTLGLCTAPAAKVGGGIGTALLSALVFKRGGKRAREAEVSLCRETSQTM